VTRRPSISLCIVARNEEVFIAQCIASARQFADECLVLDTGSTDFTMEIAKREGARVIKSRWPGNYSAAFNTVRKAARCDWIINLDADEVLDPGAPERIRSLITNPQADAFVVPIRNYTYMPMVKWRAADPNAPLTFGAPGWGPSQTIRLYRNDKRYRYSGIVHHNIGPSVQKTGGKIVFADFLIHHYGRLRIDRVGAKAEHYRLLAERKVQHDPKSGRAWIELGVVLAEQHDYQGAERCFLSALEVGYGAGAYFHHGRILYRTRKFNEAIEAFSTALELHSGDKLEPDCDSADILEYLAHAYGHLGKTRKAMALYRKALKVRPDSPAAANNLADLLARQNELAKARKIAEKIVSQYPGLDMPRATLGNILFFSGDIEGAEASYRNALACNPENLSARINLARTLATLHKPKLAANAWRIAAEREPGPGNLLDINKYIPAPYLKKQRKQLKLPPGNRPLIASIIAHLGGGAGQVVISVIRALRGYRHLVICGDPGSYLGLGLRQQLQELGAVVTVAKGAKAAALLRDSSAQAAFHHWWPAPVYDHLDHDCPVPRVIIGHGPMGMPEGCDGYVALSDFHMRAQGHLPKKLLHLIPNGVNLNRFKNRDDSNRRRRKIAMLSRLEMGKFPRRLLHFLPDLVACNAELLVAGRGPRRFEIEAEYGDTLAAKHIKFVGAIPAAQIPDFLAGVDVGLHLTETHPETCSIAIIEMLAAGLPVISQSRGCLPEMVESGRNGFLGNSEEEIADALARVLMDKKIRVAMGKESRKRARHYGLGKFDAAYRKLVREFI